MRYNPPSKAKVRRWTVPNAVQGADDPAADTQTPACTGPMHGYSLDAINHLAKSALRMDRWNKGGDVDERYAAIWHALAEHLRATAPEHRPARPVGREDGAPLKTQVCRDEAGSR